MLLTNSPPKTAGFLLGWFVVWAGADPKNSLIAALVAITVFFE
jgi:hypothetical protein